MKHRLNTEKITKGGRVVELEHREVTEQIIGSAFEVYRVLGYGFLEKVYQRAMQVELQLRGFKALTEDGINVFYKEIDVGFYRADLFVNDVVIVELKTTKSYDSEDEPQLLNELKATGIRVGLMINFGRTKSNSNASSFRRSSRTTPGNNGSSFIRGLSAFHPCSIRG